MFTYTKTTITTNIISEILCDRCGERIEGQYATLNMYNKEDCQDEYSIFCKKCYDWIISKNIHEPQVNEYLE